MVDHECYLALFSVENEISVESFLKTYTRIYIMQHRKNNWWILVVIYTSWGHVDLEYYNYYFNSSLFYCISIELEKRTFVA